MIEGKFSTELLVVGIEVGIILLHFEGMTLGSDEVKGDGLLSLMATSVDGNSSGTGTWVTPTMGTWGGATVFVAGVIAEWNGLEKRGVHKG